MRCQSGVNIFSWSIFIYSSNRTLCNIFFVNIYCDGNCGLLLVSPHMWVWMFVHRFPSLLLFFARVPFSTFPKNPNEAHGIFSIVCVHIHEQCIHSHMGKKWIQIQDTRFLLYVRTVALTHTSTSTRIQAYTMYGRQHINTQHQQQQQQQKSKTNTTRSVV